MSKLLLLAPLVLPFFLPSSLPGSQDTNPVTERYHECAASSDRAGLVELWKGNPSSILYTIDADLEGALKLVEASEEPDAAAIAALHKRALFGASCAEEATGHPILVEYATSFVGWSREQQLAFRQGQAAYGAARGAMKKGEHEAAAKHGRECAELAEPLGDWWGTAMGFSAEGSARVAAGDHEAALVPLSRARLIYHDLGLIGSEYSCLRGLVSSLTALDRNPRAMHAAKQALALAKQLGHEEGVTEYGALLAE